MTTYQLIRPALVGQFSLGPSRAWRWLDELEPIPPATSRGVWRFRAVLATPDHEKQIAVVVDAAALVTYRSLQRHLLRRHGIAWHDAYFVGKDGASNWCEEVDRLLEDAAGAAEVGT